MAIAPEVPAHLPALCPLQVSSACNKFMASNPPTVGRLPESQLELSGQDASVNTVPLTNTSFMLEAKDRENLFKECSVDIWKKIVQRKRVMSGQIRVWSLSRFQERYSEDNACKGVDEEEVHRCMDYLSRIDSCPPV
jgi:hypothetical protein